MKRWGFWCVASATFALCTPLFAHQDDPKGLNPSPPYWGEGYRKALADVTAGGPSFPANNVELLSWLPLSEFDAGSTGNDCWGYVSPSGKEYALMGLRGGVGFVDITQPDNAQIVEVVTSPSSLWHDVKVYQDYAYVVAENSNMGVQVIDMSQIDNGIVQEVTVIDDVGTSRSHNVAIDTDSGFLYRCGGGSNGLRIYDLSNPALPQFVASWSDRYVHDAQIVTYTDGPFAGKQIAFCCSGDNGGGDNTGLEILDVTDKNNIVQLDREIYANGEYSHQGWLSADRNYFYLGDELDEGRLGVSTKTFIFDVSNLNNIVSMNSFTNGDSAIGHNLYTRGNFIYEANYVSGLRIFDATDPLAPVEVAFFDTVADPFEDGFNGAWSVYPYFPSGTVIVSDMQRGLFVLDVTLPGGNLVGDMNCDGLISVGDIAGFVLALTDPAGYAASFANCDINNGDISGDGLISVSDIGPFVALLTAN